MDDSSEMKINGEDGEKHFAHSQSKPPFQTCMHSNALPVRSKGIWYSNIWLLFGFLLKYQNCTLNIMYLEYSVTPCNA